jgi:hypothetical protein
MNGEGEMPINDPDCLVIRQKGIDREVGLLAEGTLIVRELDEAYVAYAPVETPPMTGDICPLVCEDPPDCSVLPPLLHGDSDSASRSCERGNDKGQQQHVGPN